MNVNSNIITNSKPNYKNLGFSRTFSGKIEFKTVLDVQQQQSKNDDVSKTAGKGLDTKAWVKSEDNNELKEKIINFVELAVKTLKQIAEKPSKELLGSVKDLEEPQQIQQVLKLLSFIFENIDKTPLTNNDKKEFNFINLEQLVDGEKFKTDEKNTLENNVNEIATLLEKLVGVENLLPETKNILNAKLNEIVEVLQKSKDNNKITPQILDTIQKLTIQVQGVNGDLSLLKVVSKNTVVKDKITNENKNINESKTTSDLTNFAVNNNLEEKIIDFVETANNALQQHALKSSKEVVASVNSNNKVKQVPIEQVPVKQIQKILKSLSLTIESTYEKQITPQQDNKLDPINLEKLLGVENLLPATKNILNTKLNEIVEVLQKSKGNSKMTPQILDTIQKLTIQVQDVNGDLNLLKVVSKNTQEKDKISNENKNIDESKTTSDLTDSVVNNKLEDKIIDFVETANNALHQDTLKSSKEVVASASSTDKVEQVPLEQIPIEQVPVKQIQQLLKSLSLMIQSTYEKPVRSHQENDLNQINLEKLLVVEKASPEIKFILKNNISEIVTLVKELNGNNDGPNQIIDVIQKLATEVKVVNGDLRLLKSLSFQSVGVNSEDKSIKDNQLTEVRSQVMKITSENLPKNQMQSSSDTGQDNKFSGNRSFEEKFLNKLLGEDKDEMKISKAVNFMNQFGSSKTIETPRVITPNNIVISRNNLVVDVIKTIKLMEINSIKDLTVKMNPKELGEITIKVTVENGIMKASISAQNKETFILLNQNLNDITDRLKNMDIKVQSLDINIYEDSTFFNKDSSDRNNNGRQNNNRKSNVVMEEEDISVSNINVIEDNQVNKFV